MRVSVVGSMIGLSAMVAGCGSSQPAAAPPATRVDVASVAFSSAQEDRQARTLAAARDQLVRRCMTARGFTYPPTAPAPSIPTTDGPPSGAGYGLFAQFAKPAPRHTASTKRGFRRALMGSPRQTGTLHLPDGVVVTYRSSGCYAHAMATLYGSVRRYQWLVFTRNGVRSMAGERLARDPRLAHALAGWTRCMKRRGFPYPVARDRAHGRVRRVPQGLRPSSASGGASWRPRRPTATAGSARTSTRRSHVHGSRPYATCRAASARRRRRSRAGVATAVERARRIVGTRL